MSRYFENTFYILSVLFLTGMWSMTAHAQNSIKRIDYPSNIQKVTPLNIQKIKPIEIPNAYQKDQDLSGSIPNAYISGSDLSVKIPNSLVPKRKPHFALPADTLPRIGVENP